MIEEFDDDGSKIEEEGTEEFTEERPETFMEKLLDENNEKGSWIPDLPAPLFPEFPEV